jgi:hypothetical protein
MGCAISLRWLGRVGLLFIEWRGVGKGGWREVIMYEHGEQGEMGKVEDRFRIG